MIEFIYRRVRLTVRTEPSQGLNTGSIPVRATQIERRNMRRSLFRFRIPFVLTVGYLFTTLPSQLPPIDHRVVLDRPQTPLFL